MTATLNAPQRPQEGLEHPPRVGVALSGRDHYSEAYKAAQGLRLTLRPWQEYALRVITAVDEQDKWLYPEVALVAARQNGKTKILLPRVMMGLARGERIIHAAQVREISREVLMQLSPILPKGYKLRQANGQESITSPMGGEYRIVAAQRGSRGLSADLLIVDELREFEDFDFIAAAAPTIFASANPQILYLSNAGTERSVVLNDLKQRAGQPGIAYLEWSAAPHRAANDQEGWLEANPSIGYGNQTIERLQSLYDKYENSAQLAVFETEHLCRWVKSMMPRLVADTAWQQCRGQLETPNRPAMGISVDPSGKRASAALAWKQSDGSIGLLVSAEVSGNPINVVDLAVDLTAQAAANSVQVVAFDPWTDQHLARHFPVTEAINGSEFANASERFVRAVETQGIRWQQADSISADLPYVARKSTSGNAWMADRADPDRSITAALAAIRAVWMASNPQIQTPSVY
jgi:hypothetical protein